MRLTNRLNLPEALVRAARRVFGAYDKGEADISITGLIDPPRKAALERIHEDDLEEDVSDVIWALLGSSLHELLQNAHEDEAATERRLFAKSNGWTVSGAMDVYEAPGHIQDYKFTSVFSLKNGKPKPEWSMQLNGYAWLLRENQLPVSGAEVVVFLRDWSKMDARKDSSYPRHQVLRLPIQLWPPEEAERWIYQRVLAHQAALLELPLCSPEDRWERPGKWAVVKPGQKKAIKLHDTHAEAAAHSRELPGSIVEARPGMAVRCENYCSAAPFCSQFHGLVGGKA